MSIGKNFDNMSPEEKLTHVQDMRGKRVTWHSKIKTKNLDEFTVATLAKYSGLTTAEMVKLVLEGKV